MKRKLFALSLLLLLAPLAVACGDDDQGVRDAGPTIPDVITPPVPTGTTDGGGGDGGGPQLFTDFVKDIVAKDTTATSVPRTVNDKTFAPDPQDPAAFPTTFFQ